MLRVYMVLYLYTYEKFLHIYRYVYNCTCIDIYNYLIHSDSHFFHRHVHLLLHTHLYIYIVWLFVSKNTYRFDLHIFSFAHCFVSIWWSSLQFFQKVSKFCSPTLFSVFIKVLFLKFSSCFCCWEAQSHVPFCWVSGSNLYNRPGSLSQASLLQGNWNGQETWRWIGHDWGDVRFQFVVALGGLLELRTLQSSNPLEILDIGKPRDFLGCPKNVWHGFLCCFLYGREGEFPANC